ncbi:D-amino acid dehydrogenase [Saccharospirillum mangrovi]|uniref:D-amino acid dehydrogenase n=1 Tax=Saccharospirillum mangrovi TaxID=2161747 RepID=UPI000D395E92|nr:D-amino acid dehydrogenase [Saccharospirillum mangrovi]
MKAVIIGAGVVGVTTAWALQRRGMDVTVIDKADGVALETSYANAGQRSYGHVSPWASPSMIREALPSMLRRAGPLKLALPPSMRTLQFLMGMTRYALQPALFNDNRRAMLRLGQFSREQFLALDEQVSLAFDGAHGGLLKLADTPADRDHLLRIAEVMAALGIDSQWLDEAATRQQEPGLNADQPITGGLLVPGDGTGDCQRFTQVLSQRFVAGGGQLLTQTRVTQLRADAQRLHAIQLNGADWLEADAFVVCAGCGSRELARDLGVNLPIYPVKGYSLTAPIRDSRCAPVSTLIDDTRKVAMTRLGDRVRVTGFAELADFDRRLLPRRLDAIRDSLDARFPGAADWSAAEPWTGFRPMTPDGPAAIGRARQANVYYNTGHGTWGWTLAMGSAELTAQLLAEETPALDLQAFSPGRFTRG